MSRCFVIQPFDKDKFDKRYVDIFEPAIRKAGLEPYRIDRDYSVRIPIEDIEKGIRDSIICFAEITIDNPNVWYELGYANACSKDVIMVCSEERVGKFPFDIQHKQIITYKTGSISDFNNLGENITNKIQAFLKTIKTVETLNVTPVIGTEGLTSYEIAILILIMENCITDEDNYSIYSLQHEMSKAGYTDIATSIGIKKLLKKKMISVIKTADWNGNEYYACHLINAGEDWVLNNEDQLQFRKIDKEESDDFPF